MSSIQHKHQPEQTKIQPKPNQNNQRRHPGNNVKHYAFRRVAIGHSEIKILGKETYPEQGRLLPGYSGMMWVSSRILFVHSGSKAAANTDLSSTFAAKSTWTWVKPTRLPCSTTGLMQENHLLQHGVTWDIYTRELLCHCKEVLSGMKTLFSESVVFH